MARWLKVLAVLFGWLATSYEPQLQGILWPLAFGLWPPWTPAHMVAW